MRVYLWDHNLWEDMFDEHISEIIFMRIYPWEYIYEIFMWEYVWRL